MVRYLLFPFKALINAMGADFNQVCIILSAKLKMDNRRSMSLSQKAKKNPSSQLLWQAVVYVFLGLVMGQVITSFNNIMVGYTFFFSFIMIMIALIMISEFSNVLLDTRDNSILLSRPIASESILLAKIFHIAFYMLHMSLSLSLYTIISTLISHGFVAMLLLLILIVLAALFTLFLTHVFYLGLMNVVNGQKLKDIIVYFQVAMAILFMGAYQLLPRMIEMHDYANIHLPIHWWTYLVPSVWMSGSLEALLNVNYDLSHLIFLMSAVLLPILSLIVIVKVMAPKFNQNLSRLEVGSTPKLKKRKEDKSSDGFVAKMGSVLCSSSQEKTAFKMAWLMSSRERKYKQTVYPAFGYVFIFILVFLINSKADINLQKLINGKMYLLFIYMPLLLAFAATQNLCFTEESRSSWFYQSMPIDFPGKILLGAFKAVMVKYYLPIQTIIMGICFAIWGITILDDLIYGILCVVLITSLIQSWQNPKLPFSEERATQDIGSNFVKGILLMLSLAIIIGIHYGLSFVPYGILIAIPIIAFFLYLQLKHFAKISWTKIIY